jgi:hypothetical protein
MSPLKEYLASPEDTSYSPRPELSAMWSAASSRFAELTSFSDICISFCKPEWHARISPCEQSPKSDRRGPKP